MILFDCACGHRFNLTDDQAGEEIQCPKCGRLVSVPHLDELANLEPDGTLKLGELPDTPDPRHLDHASRAFTRARLDERGEPIDLRPGVEEVLAAGTAGIPASVDADQLPGPPVYDPFTGELIRPVDLKQEPDTTPPQAIPVAKPALGYATRHTPGEVLPGQLGLSGILARLFLPGNFVVWLLVGLIHAANLFIIPLPVVGLIYTFICALPLSLFWIAHLGNVIEETGPQEADELPVPLRNVSISDDIWRPFVHVGIAVLLAVIPTVLLRVAWPDAPTAAWWGAMAIFYLTLPALTLTSTSSGALNNLLPHRALGVIPACGIGYLAAAVLLFVGVETLLAGSLMTLSLGKRAGVWMLASGPTPPIPAAYAQLTPALENVLAVPTVLLGMYLLHAGAWFLGLLYRNHHSNFPWVLQHHVSTRTDTAKLLEQRRLAQTRPGQDANAKPSAAVRQPTP